MVIPTVRSMHFPHPWRCLKEATHITLNWHHGGPMGWCRHTTQEVSLRKDLTQAERRCTLAHELIHLKRGPAVIGYEAGDEREVREETARWLIPMPALVEALVWSMDDREAADVLWVDLETVQTRLVTLTAEESRDLNAALDKAELDFPKN